MTSYLELSSDTNKSQGRRTKQKLVKATSKSGGSMFRSCFCFYQSMCLADNDMLRNRQLTSISHPSPNFSPIK